MKHSRILLLISPFVLFVCWQGAGENNGFTPPKLKGEGRTQASFLSSAKQLNAWYTIERMDSCTAELDLSKTNKELDAQNLGWGKSQASEDLKKLLLFVDTTQVVSVMTDEEEGKHYKKKVVKGFPVFLVNPGSEAISVETQDGSLMMIMEAMDETGNWKAIEYWRSSWCGNSYYNYLLLPKHLMLTRTAQYEGKFKTRGRLKITTYKGTLYSNTFSTSVDPSQFKPVVTKGDD